MSDVNVLVLTGRLTEDAKKTTVNGNVSKVDLCLCNNIYYDKNNYANFFYLSVFGQKADNIFPYLKKGQCINIESRLKQNRWEKDGVKNSKLAIIVDNIQLQNCGTSFKNDNDEMNISFPPDDEVNFELPEE